MSQSLSTNSHVAISPDGKYIAHVESSDIKAVLLGVRLLAVGIVAVGYFWLRVRQQSNAGF